MDNPLKTRKGRLEFSIDDELSKSNPNLKQIITFVDEYESDNLKTITKLKRDKKIVMTRINGALKQCINDHSVITKELIGSASKRIYGALLEPVKKEREAKVKAESKKKAISIRGILIGILIGGAISLIFL